LGGEGEGEMKVDEGNFETTSEEIGGGIDNPLRRLWENFVHVTILRV
jgi:hypothetical protein